MKLTKKITFTYHVELLTGLHIGDSKENINIGGVDAPVVRRKDNNQPYIPGSSLKGKLRSLLELATGTGIKKTPKGEWQNDFDAENYKGAAAIIPILFGASGEKGKAARLLVRDAYLTEESEKKLNASPYTDMPYTEVKFENTINRISGKADNPRKFERVPAGAIFEVNFVLNVFDDENEENLKAALQTAIQLLEKDYLGGSGSRGYGQVKFGEAKIEEHKLNLTGLNL